MTAPTGAGSDQSTTHDADAGGADEAVGTLAEEAARLVDALRDLGRDQGASFADQAEALTSWAAEGLHDLDAHVATGAEECRYCPVCRAIAFARATSPEVRAHLADAASSLVQAAAHLLAPPTPPDPASPGDPASRGDETGRS